MKTEQFLPGLQDHFNSGLELLDKGSIFLGELRKRPGPYCKLLLSDLLMRGGFQARQQPGISVAHDNWASHFSKALNRLGWLRSSLNRISQAHDPLNALLANICKHLIKRETVAMDI